MTELAITLPILLAQAAPGDAPPGCGYANLVPILLMFLVIYFILIRPQQKQAREHQSLLGNLKKGDEVVTQGGMIGRIHSVTDRIVTLEVSRDVRVRVIKTQIAGLYNEREESESAKS